MAGEPGRPHYNLTFAILGLAGASFSLLQSLVAPALLDIQHELHTSTTAVTWVLTAYLLSASVATPIAGRLGDMFGKKRALVVALALLAAGTLVSALASSLALLVAGRVVQGLGGAVFPLSFGIIRDEFPRERVAGGIALISSILGIGGGLGIVLAGPIIDNLSYHWLFWIPLVAIVAAAVAAWIVVPESPVRTAGRVNWLGAGLLATWLVCLLVAVSEGSGWGWDSARVVGLLVAGALFCLGWVRAEARAAEPLVDMRMMRLRGVWTANASALLIGFGMFGSFVLVPQLVQMPVGSGFGFGASVTEAGLFLVPSTIGMLVVSPLAGRLSNTVGSRVPLVAGALVCTLAFALLATAHGEPWEVYAGTSVLGVGIGLAFASLANLVVEAVPAGQTGVATGMNTIMRSIGGSLGAQVSASVVAASAVGGVPTEHGFTAAFAVSGAAMFCAFLAALAVPWRRARAVAVPAGAVPEAAPASD